MADAAWSSRVSAGEYCIEGDAELQVGIAFGTETLRTGAVSGRAGRDEDELGVEVGRADANDGDSGRWGTTVGARRGVCNGTDNVGVARGTLLSGVSARAVGCGGEGGSDGESFEGGRGVSRLCCFDSCILRPRAPRKCRFIPDAV